MTCFPAAATVAIIGTAAWIELGEFEVLAQLSLDERGNPSVLRLMLARRQG